MRWLIVHNIVGPRLVHPLAANKPHASHLIEVGYSGGLIVHNIVGLRLDLA